MVLAATLASARADAFCRTSACGETSGQVCMPANGDDCGKPLFWPTKCLGYSVQEDGSRQASIDTIEQITRQAFGAWTSATCAGGTPGIGVADLGAVECNRPEYNEEAGNANVIMFRDEEWPYSGQGNTLALTTVTFNLDTGEIYDADLEVNGTADVNLTTDDVNVQYDLLSILTHEAGHMLGLAHSWQPDATMKIDYVPGDTSLRTLHQDDMDGICAAYPPTTAKTCDPTPRHGFGSECGSPNPEDEEGCSCSTPGKLGVSHALVVVAVLAGMFRRRPNSRSVKPTRRRQ